MDPERWRAASLHLDEALELTGDERGRWLEALRDRDPALAGDVRALLDDYEALRRKGFLEQHWNNPVGPSASPGLTLGAYRLVSPIGHGGMGVVWLAERSDGQFEGRAAVKLLDIHFGQSDARFRREANILARVTHPHIAHLIDAGVSPDGQPYLVLELVEGQPIDRYCDDRRLDVPSRVALFLDVLGAVAHAHAHRIVHRDIKPPNVLVRTDGHVKLLDFGIAKLLEIDGQPSTTSTVTLEHGAALTPAYAAPEQVRGGTVTPATDVYALGVLLYLLITGQHPCGEGASPADLMKAIVDLDPPPPSAAAVSADGPGPDPLARAANRSTTPDRLQRRLRGDLDTIVAKALKKDPVERYASVDELADDLRRHLASEPIHARRDSPVRRAVRFARRHAALTTAAVAIVSAVAVVAGYLAFTPGRDRDRATSSEPQAPSPLTSEPGEERWPNLSPDHTRVAFSWLAPNAASGRIVVKTLGSEGAQLVTGGEGDDSSPVWSPDGREIAFSRASRDPEHRREICLVPVNGGQPRVLFSTGPSLPGLAWWPARNALLFSAQRTAGGPFHLVALDLATLELQSLTSPPPAPQLRAPGDLLPAVSHDGRTLAFIRETHDGRDVFLLDLATRAERRLTNDHHRISGLTWASDGKAVIIASNRSGTDALYRVSLEDGRLVRVPNIAEGATYPMADETGLVYSLAQDDSNIYRIDLRDGRPAGPPRPIIASSRADGVPHISSDGERIVFVSSRGGAADIWVASADGANPRRVASMPVASGPRWSPDGRSIAFGAVSSASVRPDIWIVVANGGRATQLTSDPSYETMLSWAADGRSLYVISDRTGMFEIWNITVPGAAATRVTNGGGLRAQESADGASLYFANDVPEVWRRPLRSKSPDELVTTFPKGTHWGGEWIAGARGLYVLNDWTPGSVGIDFLPFGAGQRAVRLATLTSPPARSATMFAVAPDESWLVWAQDDYRSIDIMFLPHR
jgi:serine/threonine protein kinase/dipeptidyl aminopeptidase/acylaminoacyl peptidase